MGNRGNKGGIIFKNYKDYKSYNGMKFAKRRSLTGSFANFSG